MKAILIVSTWLSVGPQISTSSFEQMAECRIAMKEAATMVQQQALSNLTGPHRELVLDTDSPSNRVTLRTPATGREVMRLQCIGSGP
ncbi:hypothetical protein LP417_33040 (plasmid) [Polaromonas sp. P1-6]|nr:hypothetical protein LP417_33040 [Polaromonas sp. P1-6]